MSLCAETCRSYGELIGNYLVPYLGGMLVSEVRTRDVQGMFASVIRRHEAAGRALSPATLQRVYATARAVVWTEERAAAWRRDGTRPVVAVWAVSQTAQFLRLARQDRWYVLFHLAALCGLRRGEACGLRWEDLDLDEGTLAVARQVQRLGGRLVECAPKSAAGARTLALDHTTVTALRQHRHRQDPERIASGDRWREGGWEFTYCDGRPLAPDRLTRHFAALRAASPSALTPSSVGALSCRVT